MDAIYKTCKYNFPCFFLTVKTSVGIGQVVATIIVEFETEEMLSQGLEVLKTWNPTWNPAFFMTDKSVVELNATAQVHPKAVRLVCDFHRAQAQNRWINKNSNGIPAELKNVVSAKLKQLAYTSTGMNTVMLRIRNGYLTCMHVHILFTEEKFQDILQSIKTAPWYTTNPKWQQYLESEWLSCKPVSL